METFKISKLLKKMGDFIMIPGHWLDSILIFLLKKKVRLNQVHMGWVEDIATKIS